MGLRDYVGMYGKTEHVPGDECVCGRCESLRSAYGGCVWETGVRTMCVLGRGKTHVCEQDRKSDWWKQNWILCMPYPKSKQNAQYICALFHAKYGFPKSALAGIAVVVRLLLILCCFSIYCWRSKILSQNPSFTSILFSNPCYPFSDPSFSTSWFTIQCKGLKFSIGGKQQMMGQWLQCTWKWLN